MVDSGRGAATRETRPLGHDNPRRPGRLRLRLVRDGGEDTIHALEGPALTIGRSRTCDVVLEDPSVSALHAEIRMGVALIELVDLGSHNGTFLNGRRVKHVTLQPGDEIRVGSSVLELVAVEEIDVEVYPGHRFGQVIGRSRVMRELFARLAVLAPTTLDVLVIGETGTGKEEIARSVHAASASARSRGPFVVLDCGCLPPTLTESALFGHVRGAFTGAATDQVGAFEQAHGGTIFIDEIGELPLEQQVKLLRVLDRREYSRVGESRMRMLDVRVIAATHRDLRKLVEVGTFRQDLYYRLARAIVQVPPLRIRDDDAEVLAREFLTRYAREGQRLTLDDSARAALREHQWPGNVRELLHVIERAAVTAKDEAISRGSLLLEENREHATKIEEALRLRRSYREVHDAVDRWLLPKVLDESKGIITRAAKHLNVDPKTLRNRMKRLGLYELDDGQDD
jgi:transcriptional regulator with GAF, ATPase, and Fis domain